ncbi:phage antirepressor KilAC domain-containing protein [Citrobacter sp. Cpo114]|uniref:phage antirepressor KilAC domain-containing protein n=1 Tax=Citrobacter sp. Cpo114 TaxID=2985147 RepID=UPI0025819296|nr:phage antirepressor KilAC domain-containing protein [Citrobacter sp. Cpo114]MDM2792507.1 phage antirepressor KilAC domain-containing protein [Citrobacter sp. Cpo114]
MNALNLVVNNDSFFKLTGEVTIAGSTFIGKEFKGQKVMTVEDLMTVTQMEKDAIKSVIKRCDTLSTGDYIKVDGDELRKIKEIIKLGLVPNCTQPINQFAPKIVFFTRNGLGQITQKVDGGRFLWEALKREYFDVEEQPVFNVPQTFGEALILAGQLEEQRAQLALENHQKEQLLIQQEAEHETFVDMFFDESKAISIGIFAKITGVFGKNQMFDYLRNSSVMMQSNGNEPYQQYMKHFIIRGAYNTPLLKCSSAKWLLGRMVRDNLISASKKEWCYEEIKAKYSNDLDAALSAA